MGPRLCLWCRTSSVMSLVPCFNSALTGGIWTHLNVSVERISSEHQCHISNLATHIRIERVRGLLMSQQLYNDINLPSNDHSSELSVWTKRLMMSVWQTYPEYTMALLWTPVCRDWLTHRHTYTNNDDYDDGDIDVLAGSSCRHVILLHSVLQLWASILMFSSVI